MGKEAICEVGEAQDKSRPIGVMILLGGSHPPVRGANRVFDSHGAAKALQQLLFRAFRTRNF